MLLKLSCNSSFDDINILDNLKNNFELACQEAKMLEKARKQHITSLRKYEIKLEVGSSLEKADFCT